MTASVTFQLLGHIPDQPLVFKPSEKSCQGQMAAGLHFPQCNRADSVGAGRSAAAQDPQVTHTHTHTPTHVR